MLEMSYHTVGNRYTLVPELCKYKPRKKFIVNAVVKLWNMLPDELVSVIALSAVSITTKS